MEWKRWQTHDERRLENGAKSKPAKGSGPAGQGNWCGGDPEKEGGGFGTRSSQRRRGKEKRGKRRTHINAKVRGLQKPVTVEFLPSLHSLGDTY